jgi:hypothetical protein
MSTTRITSALLVALGLTACGGGGTSTVARRRLDIVSTGVLDGWVRSDGELSNRGDGPGVGDLDTNQEVRLVLSFELGAIPAGVRVELATLRFRAARIVGSPQGLNPLQIERIDMGTALGAVDFSTLPLSAPTSVTINNLLVVRDVDVTTLVQEDLDEGRSRTDLRLRLLGGTDGDLRTDFLGIETGDNDWRTGDRARLEITYER